MRWFPNVGFQISLDDNRVLLLEQSGKFDLQTMMKTIRVTAFMLNRFRSMEKVLKRINEEERKDRKMSSAVMIIDLEGLSFQSNLISFISGNLQREEILLVLNLISRTLPYFVGHFDRAISIFNFTNLYCKYSDFYECFVERLFRIHSSRISSKLLLLFLEVLFNYGQYQCYKLQF